MISKFTEEDIEEMLTIKAFNDTMAELYRHNCRYLKEDRTYSQIKNEEL